MTSVMGRRQWGYLWCYREEAVQDNPGKGRGGHAFGKKEGLPEQREDADEWGGSKLCRVWRSGKGIEAKYWRSVIGR